MLGFFSKGMKLTEIALHVAHDSLAILKSLPDRLSLENIKQTDVFEQAKCHFFGEK